MTSKNKVESRLLLVLLAVPAVSSIISAIHLVNFVKLGNPLFIAGLLAFTFELGSVVSFITLGKNIMRRLKKDMLFAIFIILFILQAFGNVYSSFDYIGNMLVKDPTWLASFREMFFNMIDVTTAKLVLACIIGLPIPVISLMLLKSAVDYFSYDEKKEHVTQALQQADIAVNDAREKQVLSRVVDQNRDEDKPLANSELKTAKSEPEAERQEEPEKAMPVIQEQVMHAIQEQAVPAMQEQHTTHIVDDVPAIQPETVMPVIQEPAPSAELPKQTVDVEKKK